MIEIVRTTESGSMHVCVSGRITQDEYERFTPKFDAFVAQHGFVRVMVEMRDFHGWRSLKALWRDVRFDMRVNPRVERTAMVGERNWQDWMTRLSRPFAKGDLCYFDATDLDRAWEWVAPVNAPQRSAPLYAVA